MESLHRHKTADPAAPAAANPSPRGRYTPCGSQGPKQAGPSCAVEDKTFGVYAAIKAINPKVTTILYWNSMFDFAFYRVHQQMIDLESAGVHAFLRVITARLLPGRGLLAFREPLRMFLRVGRTRRARSSSFATTATSTAGSRPSTGRSPRCASSGCAPSRTPPRLATSTESLRTTAALVSAAPLATLRWSSLMQGGWWWHV